MKQKSLLRNKKYDLSLLDKLKNKSGKNEYIELDGVNVKITSQRYQVFKNSSTCCECGMKAEFLATEKPTTGKNNIITDNYHINMYGLDEETGEEILFTKDHILPKSKGGKNKIDNYQTMCVRCNGKKGNDMGKIGNIFVDIRNKTHIIAEYIGWNIQMTGDLCMVFNDPAPEKALTEDFDFDNKYGYVFKYYSYNSLFNIIQMIEDEGYRFYLTSTEEKVTALFTDMNIQKQKHDFGGGNIIAIESGNNKINVLFELVIKMIKYINKENKKI